GEAEDAGAPEAAPTPPAVEVREPAQTPQEAAAASPEQDFADEEAFADERAVADERALADERVPVDQPGPTDAPMPEPQPRADMPPDARTPTTTRKERPGRGLDAPLAVVSGIGEKRSEHLARLGLQTIGDMLYHYPRRYEDYSQLKTIDQLEYGERVSLLATVWEAGSRRTHTGKHLFRAIVSDATGTLEVSWFGRRGLEGRIRTGMQILLSGKVDEYLGRLTMNSPEWEMVGRSDVTSARIQPIYPLTEGLTQRWMRSTMRRVLGAWAGRVPEVLPEELRGEHGLLPVSRALWGIHSPDSQEHLAASRRRLAFEQTLYLQLGLLRQKLMWKSQEGRQIQVDAARVAALTSALPYELTCAQQRSLDEMLRDLASGEPMNRLLQGDVGSGKTVVAGLLMALLSEQGLQAALMAPTEILAEQHYRSLSALFAAFPDPSPTVGLLTGSVGGEAREATYSGLADGSLQVVVGTHALIQEAVIFRDLALVVIDEQHRFGVEQRGTLREKGYNPHLLVMTATPIPRSLELTVWGHVDVSVLDEMPPGRQPIQTRVLYPRERGRAYTFIRSQAEKGRQAFIVYPLVEASDKIDARAAVDEQERLQQEVFPTLRVGLLHGRMSGDEKDEVMTQFAGGDLDVLVATTVIEVGIDIPNATVMLIDGADRFGLAQLHQLRGRVGRGGHQSYCLLLAEDASEDAAERLRAVERTNDGFELAEKDLEMRGPGEFLGTRQSGFPEFPMATFTDTRLLHEVREVAERLLEQDPDLAQPQYEALRERVSSFWEASGDLS
ncbi:MAG: ATP-dependent DNA helicase RecG, partial [Anaerolineae bacterium]|nr:ATP-dependent DNA helicase RecG [Anaerolineae bacterium]